MNINNNWIRNIDTGKWKSSSDVLVKTDFDSLKQEYKSYRFYQKCLSGSTYVGVNSRNISTDENASIQNVYDLLNITATSSSYYFDNIGTSPLTYAQPFTGTLPNYPSRISNTQSLSDFINKVIPDYNLTLKNLFTPERLIKDQKENLFYVDLSTTETIPDLNVDLTGLILDGVTVKEGHTILVKDQYSIVTIPSSFNPDEFFYGFYEIEEVIGTLTQYRVYNSDNGIYRFQNKRLVRTTDLDSYDDVIRYSICVKLGNSNREKQYKLLRLKNGFFPLYKSGNLYPGGPSGEPIYFEESHNWILRQRVDYNNLYELSLQDTLKHATQSLTVELISGSISSIYSYTIPQRTITVGEFGSIINHQESISNFINNKYKTTLRSISETTRYYWICGDEGIFLRVDKIDFSIERIELNFPSDSTSDTVITTLLSVHFFNDLRGAVVGKFNQIWTTSDGGKTWNQIYLFDFDGFNYNKVLFTSIDKFYVGGDNGVFIEFEYNLNEWSAYKRRISKYLDGLDDEYLLVDDIIDMTYFIKDSKSFIAIGCEMNSLYLYDISNSISSTYSFWYLQDTNFIDNNFGDISGITWVDSDSSLFFSTFESIYKVDPLDGFISISGSNIFSTTFSNFLTQSTINDISSFENELIYTGNFSLWQKSDLNGVTSSVYDSNFFDRLKPRLLFLDYDIGSKLYWFDDFGQYRLPNRYEVPVNYLISPGVDSSIGFNKNTKTVVDVVPVNYFEENWITYWKDTLKTFAYHTSLSEFDLVEPSFTFSSSDAVGKTFSYSTMSVSNQYLDIVELMPSAVPPMQIASITQSSRFRNSGSDIILGSTAYGLYFYDYLGIWHLQLNDSEKGPEVGDILKIDSDIFEGKFVINRVLSTQSVDSPASPSTLNMTVGSTFTASVAQVSYSGNPITSTFSLPASSDSPSNIQNMNIIVNAINASFSVTGFQASRPSSINLFSPPGQYYGLITLDIISGETPSSIIGEFVGGSDEIYFDNYYCYFYTDFNENIINNIPSSKTGFTVRDLNKYPLTPNGQTSSQYFVDNLNNHYLGLSYECELVDQNFRIIPKYSQYSAYYNLQATIDVKDITSATYSDEIKYTSGFLNFGYSPTYNLLSYLNFLNPEEYTPTKEFYAMSNWESIPGPQNSNYSTQSSIYIDAGIETNKIYFGDDLKYIYDSLLLWTFIDIYFNDGLISDRLLIIDKSFDEKFAMWVIELHDRIEFNPSMINIDTVSIYSRRTLQQISDDLQYLNNIHRPKLVTKYSFDTTGSAEIGSWDNFESDIKTKYPTDSYAKILLSDNSIIRDLTGLLYTDYKYELSMQVTKLDREFEFRVSNIALNGSNYLLQFSEPHLLNNNDYVVVSMIGSQSLYPSTLLGYHNVTVVDPYTIQLPVGGGLFGLPNFDIFYTKKDYFFNFQPVDLFDLGIGDKKIKQSIEIKPENWDVVGSRYDLLNVNLKKYKFRLIDGLDLVSLNSSYPWILEAEISDATIGRDNLGNLVWYKGVWQCGRWFGGNWISGSWLSGDWYDGNWTSKVITDNTLNVKFDSRSTTNFNSIWYGGRWFSGNWENGTWYDGRWYGGTWSDGRWFDGTWNDGLWKNGQFNSGIWVLGQWDNGIFNTDNGPAFWLDGKFYGGDFENGVWYNGIFDQKNGLVSRFGTNASNSRNAIWRAGKFLAGQFHSLLNTNDNGFPDVSDVHKYSKWYTGVFSGGDFYGGIAYNINFKNTVWHGGIVEDIEVVAISTNDSTISLKGEWNFNVNDEIYLVDNGNFGTFSIFGSTEEPKEYKVLLARYDVDSDITNIFTNVSLQSLTPTPLSGSVSNLRCVSNFRSSTWNSGVWYNGVFKDGVFNGGVWYNGFFEGTWG